MVSGVDEIAFSVLMDPGDECIIPVPGWFCYTTILRARNAVPVNVPLLEGSFDLEVAAIEAATTTQVARGWGFPDAPLQYAVADLEAVSIDIGALQGKRDRLHGALTRWDYAMTKPAGTFYLWGRAPGGDSVAFSKSLADRGVFVMPGTLFERPTDFRISLTASAGMIEASLPAFKAAAG